MSAFEIISKDEFEKGSGSGGAKLPTDTASSEGVDTRVSFPEPEQLSLETETWWCGFCKGYYIREYHFGEEVS